MSVSMKTTKAAMYSEIERLRALLDHEGQRNVALLAEKAALRSQLEERKAKSEERKAKSEAPEPREVTISKMEIGRRLAILMKRTVRPAADGLFESHVDGEWVVIPERVVRHAAGAA